MTIREAVEQYIAWKRTLGFRFESCARELHHFLRTLGDGVGCDQVTAEQVTAFLGRGPAVTRYRSGKYSVLAGFYRYATSRGLASRSPLPPKAPPRPPDAPPHIYSRDELRRLLAATETYSKRIRLLEPHTFRMLLLLLYGAGLRRGEALRLTLADVDLPHRLLTIRKTKFHKTRLVPSGPQLTRALQQYAGRRTAGGASQAPAATFLVYRDGAPLVPNSVTVAFAKLRQAAAVRGASGARQQPRLHDLRHAFAVHRLTAWYRQGADVQRLLPLLSTYLGHASVASTQVYLTMTPELLREASLRFARYAEPGMGGRDD